MLHCQPVFYIYDRDPILYEIIDDDLIQYRGPKLNKNRYMVCVGTGATFGRFVSSPFPMILNTWLPTINFGYGHLETHLLLNSKPHMNIMDNATMIIVQYSSLRKYREKLDLLLKRFPNHLLMGFESIQSEGISDYPSAIRVPGTSLYGWYPDAGTHDLAAAMIRQKLETWL